MDEPEIAAIDEEAGGLTEDEDRIVPMDGVDEQHQPPADAQVPEGGRYDARLQALGGEPLDEETAEEEGLSSESDSEP